MNDYIYEYICISDHSLQERELALEREQNMARAQRERDLARMMAVQEKVKDEIAERDELRVRRAQEQLERDWRRKEAEAALKKVAMTQDLAEAREVQKRQKQQARAAQAHREKMDFERVLKSV